MAITLTSAGRLQAMGEPRTYKTVNARIAVLPRDGGDPCDNEQAVDLRALSTKHAALQARLDLAAMFAAGEIDGSQLRWGRSVDLRRQLAGIDAVLADADSVSPVAALLCDDKQTLG
jgi:hypothetical protein